MNRILTGFPVFHPGIRAAKATWVGTPAIKQWLMRMHAVITLLFTLFLTGIAGESSAQRVSFSGAKLTLSAAMAAVSDQTGYYLMTGVDLRTIDKEITLVVDNQPLRTVLADLLSGTGITYVIDDERKTIVLKKAPGADRGVEGHGGTRPQIAGNGAPLILAFPEVKGKIVDSLGNSLVGASVRVLNAEGKRTTLQTTTDSQGDFVLRNVPEDAVLELSYVGYVARRVNAGKDLGTISLQAIPSALDEVEINAGYWTVKDRERTGSIARVTKEEIERQPVSNPMMALHGRMAGVNVSQQTGAPGGAFRIQIRGINSLRTAGNEPLYIVDGVPYSSQSLGNAQFSSILRGATTPLNSINPLDIASIEVLKDADATAIYGSRGANGVVLISTKKAQQGKASLDVHAYSGFGKVASSMEMMNTDEYLAMRREAFANDGVETYPAYAYDVNGAWDQGRYTDWRKELIGGTAAFNSLQASLSGGSAATQYLLSGTYRKESTVFPGDDRYDRISVQSSTTHRSPDDRFLLNLSVNYAVDNNGIRATDLSTQAYVLAPNAPALYDEDGNLNWGGNTFDNPLAPAVSVYENKVANLIANSMMSYKLLPKLTLKANLGYTDTRLSEHRTQPSTMYSPAYGATSAMSILFKNEGNQNSWIIEPQLDFSDRWNDHHIDALVGTTFQAAESHGVSQRGTGFSSNHFIRNLSAANTRQILGSQDSEYRYQALFGRVNYKFSEKYLVNLTGRRDASSRFGSNRRVANFGALGAAWVFSSERFAKDNLPWLSFGKLRGSYGITGSDQIGDYQYLDTYSISGRLYNGSSTLRPTQLYNPDFGWETNRKFEIAAELGLWNDRVFVTTAWYHNLSSNQLVGMPLPATAGFPQVQSNMDATIRNTGLEVEMRTTNIRKGGFHWTSSFNITLPRNKMLRFDGLEGSTYANTYVIGQSLSIWKVYHHTGINQATGTYRFEDYNGDGHISTPADRQFIADLFQDWFGGFGNHISFENWSMDFLLQFVKQDGRNYLYSTGLAGGMWNMPKYAINHWPANGTEAEVQLYSTGMNPEAINAYFASQNSSLAVSDASFLRLKNVNLSYRLPASWSARFSGSVYLQGQNLFTFTAYKGIDPENQSTSFLPPLRQLTLGLQFRF